MEEKTKILLDILDKKTDGISYNIYQDITHCTLDIICETAMGVNVNAMSNPDNEFIQAVYTMSDIIPWKMSRPYIPEFIFNILPQGYKSRHALKVLHGFSENIISSRKKILQNKSSRSEKESSDADELFGIKKRLSLLDMLLEASEDGKILSDADIREEVDTFVFEGHDTTTSSISWTLLLLGNNPEIQEKLYQEIKEVLQDKSIPSFNNLPELKYLECVIKESLRMFPSVPFIIRTIEQEIQIDQYKIPAGTDILLHIYALHNSPEYYPNPDVFDPDRFLPENCVGRHPYSYIPFSAGPRNCIGQKFAMYEEKTILASIIKRYKVTAMEKIKDIKVIPDIVLRPINGVLVTLQRRE
ncbi:cytochrome p450 family 4 [Holotrichia oblita]|uniref:Cytochrome p450 family 4 n=1 Tax=Holotrichia oblita TaxID=644536 RepID=A0ACB9TC84_HOLOL|nr:cytochrome p450 family 4 [Holotrichia oblita]